MNEANSEAAPAGRTAWWRPTRKNKAQGSDRSAGDAFPSPPRPLNLRAIRLAIVAVALVIAVGVGGLLAAFLLWEREEALANEEHELVGIARFAAEQTSNVFQSISHIMDDFLEHHAAQALAAAPGDARIQEILQSKARLFPFTRSVLITDALGKVVHEGRGIGIGTDLSDREYFRVHRDGRVTDLYIGDPVQSRVIDDWFLPVSHRLVSRNGEFAGIVMFSVSTPYFQRLYESARPNGGSFIALTTRGGIMVARGPSSAAANPGSSLAHTPLFTKMLAASESGQFRSVSVTDGVERLFAYRTLERFPLVVIAGLGVSTVLSTWHDLSTWLVRGGIAGFALLAGFAAFGWRYIGEREETQRRIFDFALFPLESPSPVFRVSRDGTVVFSNPAACRFVADVEKDSQTAGRWRELLARAGAATDRTELEFAAGGKTFGFAVVPVATKDYRAVYGYDLTMQKAAEYGLARSNRLLNMLGRVNNAIVTSSRTDAMLSAIARNIAEHGGYPLVWVGEVTPGSPAAVHPIACFERPQGGAGALQERQPDPIFIRGPSAAALRERKIVVARDDEPGFEAWRARALSLRSAVCVPVMANDRASALLVVFSHYRDAFQPDELKALETIALDVGYALRVADSVQSFDAVNLARLAARERFEVSLVNMVGALSRTIEMRDPYTAGHQERVSRIAEAMARKLGLQAEQIKGIRLGALMHDIGKIGVPADILTKPTRLMAPELELVKMHTQVGFDIVKDIDFPWPIARMILEHHERLDGSGYPRGLKGEQICIEAQIIGVADIAEAVTSHRPYRPALGLDVALAELKRLRGKSLDPRLVDVCVEVISQESGKAPSGSGAAAAPADSSTALKT